MQDALEVGNEVALGKLYGRGRRKRDSDREEDDEEGGEELEGLGGLLLEEGGAEEDLELLPVLLLAGEVGLLDDDE